MQTIQGRIIKFLPKQEGETARGHWVKAGFVIEYGDEYPRKASFSLFGEERLQMCKGLTEGMSVQVNYNPESREYQDRWYTDLNCVRIEPLGGDTEYKPQPQSQSVQTQTPSQDTSQNPTPAPKSHTMMPPEDDGLPF